MLTGLYRTVIVALLALNTLAVFGVQVKVHEVRSQIYLQTQIIMDLADQARGGYPVGSKPLTSSLHVQPGCVRGDAAAWGVQGLCGS